MTKTEYAEYLGSEHWQQFRKEILAEIKSCERCDVPRWLAQIVYDQDLHIHHLNYASRGKETAGDVEVLCRRCHEVETFGRSDLQEIPSHDCLFCGGKSWDKYSDHCSQCQRMLELGDQEPLFLTWNYTNPRSGRPLWRDIANNLASLALYRGVPLEEIVGRICEDVAIQRSNTVQEPLDDGDIPF